jgi:hypothetical protein
MNESSESEFLIKYGRELKAEVKNFNIFIKKYKNKLQDLYPKVFDSLRAFKIYDKNLVEEIVESIFNEELDMNYLIELALNNSMRYGTEPHFVIDAINDVYNELNILVK